MRSEKRNKSHDKFVLLGIWNQFPLSAWQWFSDIALNYFHRLTGRRIKVFTYFEKELHYQYFFAEGVRALKRDLDKLPAGRQELLVKKIIDDCEKQIPGLEIILNKIKNQNLGKLDNSDLIEIIKKMMLAWSKVTTQIWYVVLLDIWYPSLLEKKNLKKIGSKVRDEVGKIHEYYNGIEYKLYKEIAKRLMMSVKSIYYCFPEEIIKALQTGKSLEVAAQKRRELAVTMSTPAGYKIYGGEKAKELLGKYKPPAAGTKKLKELRGLVANRGKVRGRVRVITLDKEFSKFRAGEILVTLQTMTQYLPVMKKAKAILTEFGGLTSHAAIISRELKKPCIVGIQNLLVSFKTGDKVSVDAEKGIIKKLK
ncbi:MAG: PEP-utilizing enzyme [Patescibacteria group bacterium]